MFKKILLPLDLTDKHARVLSVVREMAEQTGGEVVLLHVVETIPGLPEEEERGFYERLERAARAHLARWGQSLEQHKLPWRAEVRLGSRVVETVRYAAEMAADLIILTAPRLDPNVPGPGWGSMSYRIGILAQSPVLLVK